MTLLDSEHQLGSAVEAARGVLAAPGSAASADTRQHLDGLGGVVAGAGPGALQGGAPVTHIPTLT
eukprot:3830858-Lingulodinium_polyedra.AAC.1